MKYEAKFVGRLSGAIGITYKITDTVEAENKEKAEIELYKKYENISCLSLKEQKT